ncbi:unnamed protein product [Vitrella brassicaformis CCMP3155]|uniref:Lipocalin/cytosolic fatty-acid binding domain-containing protein n=2 Tax=Vitrella brassicaformis TaxID=1169539 RepID=A0A0G4GNP7_VITBC|nr:unnamed protein product [Vitrella brassicaformis CCMP3155]|eukprot:CEM31923.1 unnamed protein product [Vitrella brassicaformis CCMP3155]
MKSIKQHPAAHKVLTRLSAHVDRVKALKEVKLKEVPEALKAELAALKKRATGTVELPPSSRDFPLPPVIDDVYDALENFLRAVVRLLLGGKRGKLTIVKGFKPGRYLGRWYEVASIKKSYEKGLGDTTAVYSRGKGGTIKARNAGYTKKGVGKQVAIEGAVNWPAANTKDKEGRLTVTFSFLKGLVRVTAPYVIIDLGGGGPLSCFRYTHAVVCNGPARTACFILSRRKKLPDRQLRRIFRKLHAMGFNTRKITLTPQLYGMKH